jgi:hypothetical protein
MTAKAKTLDFTGVKDGGGNFRPRRRKEGDYYAHITAVADHTSKEGNDGWVFTLTVDGDNRATYPYYVNFDQLWKPRALCIAAGIAIPGKRVKLDPNKLVGKALGVALIDDEYEGRMKSAVDAVFPLEEMSDPMNEAGKASKAKAKSRQADDDDDEDEDDEDEPPAKAKGKSKSSKKSEPDDDEDEDDEEEDEPPAKKTKSKAKRKPADDDDDEDDDEDDEPPAKSKSKAKAKSKKKAKDDDDDDELDLDDL